MVMKGCCLYLAKQKPPQQKKTPKPFTFVFYTNIRNLERSVVIYELNANSKF